MKNFLIASCVALALSTAAFADLGAELTSPTHAGLAAKATTIDMVHMHLHHALNCLVGPGGTGFDSTNANPCAKAGDGAIPDASAAQKAKLQPAVAAANAGLAAPMWPLPRPTRQKASAAIEAAK